MAEQQSANVRKNEKIGTVVSTKMAEDHRCRSEPPGTAPDLQAHRHATKKFYAHDEDPNAASTATWFGLSNTGR